MIRKHGWQLPAHKYQVIAITVFCLLVIAFYAFLAPFLGSLVWKYTLIGVYTPVILTVFILYVRCTAINPADPGISSNINCSGENKPDDHVMRQNMDETASVDRFSSVSSSVVSQPSGSAKKDTVDVISKSRNNVDPAHFGFCRYLGGVLCLIFVLEDCRSHDDDNEQQNSGEEALYCTLCNTEVRKLSKHCRSCDKCVDGFDHHCRWLNNCVGNKNYYTFIALMAMSLIWLVLESGVGIAVFVRCFADKKSMKAEIVDNLGNVFSQPLFATVVAISTAVSLLACVPLGELFFFHMILIRKGISTYEYVVAMRTISEAPTGPPADEELPAMAYSPTGSAATGFSGGSSHGLSYKGAWCTPPRIFVDYQEEVVPHLEPGLPPSTVDPDAEKGTKGPKKPVRISAWKLAKLDSNEAMRAAAKARASSSVLKPLEKSQLGDIEISSSENMSVRSSISIETGTKIAIQTSRDDYETGTQSLSSFSSPVNEPISTTSIAAFNDNLHFSSAPKGYNPPPLPPSTSLLRAINRTSVVWDQEAGRYVSVPVSAYETRNKTSFQTGSAKQIPPSRSVFTSHESSSSGIKNTNQPDETFMYSGDSIFFGGPMMNTASGRGLISKEGQTRMSLSLPRDARYKREANSNQIPVFVPGGLDHDI